MMITEKELGNTMPCVSGLTLGELNHNYKIA